MRYLTRKRWVISYCTRRRRRPAAGKARREEGPIERERKTREQWADALLPYGIFVLIVVYGLLFKTFGIVAASLIVPPVILFLLRCRKWYMYLILYAFFGLMYALFTMVLHVPIK